MAEQGKDKTAPGAKSTTDIGPGNDKQASILHLSDLHFGADKQSDPVTDAEKWYGQLADDLYRELKCDRLDAIIISGDVGNFSEPGEYMAAHIFIDLLCEKFGVGKNCLVIVPGNHDLNRKYSKKGTV